MNDKILEWAVKIQSIAQAGLTYGHDSYDRERYEQLRHIAAEMVVERADPLVDKEFRKANQTRPLSFASEEDLLKLLGLAAGSVTPLGVLNDEERKVTVFLDRDFFEESGLIGVHPNDNTATVWLKAEDLVRLIGEHGNRIHVVPI